MMPDIVTLLPSAGLSFVVAWFWFDRNAKAKALEIARLETVDRDERITELEKRHAVLVASITPFEEAYKQMLIKQLTHFHTPELDALLVKVGPPDTLTDEDRTRMAELLAARAKDLDGRIDDAERDAAIILPIIIKRAKAEAATIADPATGAPTLVVVAVAAPELVPDAAARLERRMDKERSTS